MNKKEIQPGDKFGQWEVIEFAGYRNGSRRAYKCKCKCDREVVVLIQSLLSGFSTQCRICSNQEKAKNNFKDLRHQEFGQWKVSTTYKITKQHRTLWLCECSCGKTKYVKMDSLVSGASTCCGKCNNYEEIYGIFWDEKMFSAKRRNIEWTITKEEAWNLFLKQERKCKITGLPIRLGFNRKKITASIDRIDSSKGYTIDNIQWTHQIVNIIKWNLQQEDFLYVCKVVYQNNIKNIIDKDIDQMSKYVFTNKKRMEK